MHVVHALHMIHEWVVRGIPRTNKEIDWNPVL